MKKGSLLLISVTGAVVIVALWLCWLLRPSSLAPVPAVTSFGWSPPGPQPKLLTTKLWVGDQELVVEVARQPSEIYTGLMFRTNLSSNEGMIFVLPVSQQARFYMRNTLIPLSCAYLDDEGVILEVHDMNPRDETTIASRSANVRFVIEANQGWFEQHHIGPGVLVATERGKLPGLLHNPPLNLQDRAMNLHWPNSWTAGCRPLSI